VTTATATQTTERRRVRVWFGEHVIADYNAEPALAERYANAMSRRFAGLRVTNDPMPAIDKLPDPLPGERMWDVCPSLAAIQMRLTEDTVRTGAPSPVRTLLYRLA
jgi:hypothetical protein